MANEKHMYATIAGGYSNAGEDPERWQFGVRLALVFGVVSDVDTLPNNWDVVPNTDSTTSGDWGITTNWSADGPASATFNPQSYMTDYLLPSVLAYVANPVFGADSFIDLVKLYAIGTNGLVIGGRSCTATATTPAAGDVGGDTLPLQNSVVISTRTLVIGRRGRGRWYMPCLTTNSLGAHGRLTSTATGNQLASAKAFLEGLAFASVAAGDPHVKAIVTGKPYTEYGVITGVQVGDVVDTQRRRRRQLVEVRVSDTVDT